MNVVYLDIETQRTDDPVLIKRLQDEVQPPANYSKPETIAKWHAEQGAAARLDAVNKTALDGTYGRLATIGYSIDGWEPHILSMPEYEHDEVRLMTAFKECLEGNGVKHPYFVAFNGAGFDFRFLYQRAVINNVKGFPRMPLGKKDDYFDPMLEWAGYRGYVKQQDLERVLGFERQDPLRGGQDVGEAIDAGDWVSVIEHNTQDILGLRYIYQRMTG